MKIKNYKEMLMRKPKDHCMLVEDENTWTYGQFLELVKDVERQLQSEGLCGSKETLYFIWEETIVMEFATWIACQGLGMVPVLLPEPLSKEEQERYMQELVPEHAIMGVMTSGSTGNAKLLFRTYESWADFFEIQNEIFEMCQDTVLFAHGSLAFTGNLNLYLGLFFLGATVVATKRFQPVYWEKMIVKRQVNYIYLIPTKIMALARVVKQPIFEIRHFVTGSQAFGKEQVKFCQRAFPNMETILYYGCSEASYLTYLHAGQMTEDPTLVGSAFPNVKVSVIEGVFCVDSSYGVIGLQQPFFTNDLGREDAEGRFYFEGRRDDILNVNGRKCHAYRIQKIIQSVLGISEVLVDVIKEENRDVLVAFYEGDYEMKLSAQWKKCLREYLPEYEIPKRFIKVELLERTSSGKIRRKSRKL